MELKTFLIIKADQYFSFLDPFSSYLQLHKI